MTDRIKLTYFNSKGKGEIIRLILIASNVDFEDNRISVEEWAKMKPLSQCDQVPFVELSQGLILNESSAIVRFFARKNGLAGSTELDEYRVDRAYSTLEELLEKALNAFYIKDKTEKENFKNNLKEVHLPVFLKRLTRYLNEPGDFFLGSQPSYADLQLVNVLDHFDYQFNDFPKILNCYDKVLKHYPQLASYKAQRPVTEF